MNVPEIITVVGQLDDELIAAAVDYKPKKKKAMVVLRFAIPAACLLFVLSVFVLRPEINDEFFGSVLPWGQEDEVYKTAVLASTEPTAPIHLFAYAAELPGLDASTLKGAFSFWFDYMFAGHHAWQVDLYRPDGVKIGSVWLESRLGEVFQLECFAGAPGLRVRVRHATFMTASIPPQTTAFEIQIL